MGFEQFHGNRDIIDRLRGMMARDRFPHAVILAGPAGSGKYTLAQMLAKAMNCLSPSPSRAKAARAGDPPPPGELPDFCGSCRNCVRIAEADDLEARCTE